MSEDEIKKLHQEEGKLSKTVSGGISLGEICLTERKIASMTSEQLLNLSRLDDVDEEDEDEDEDGDEDENKDWMRMKMRMEIKIRT